MVDAPTPKDRFTSLDTLALVRELRGLGRARVDKAFDLAGGGWTLVLRRAGAGRRELRLVEGRYAALVDVKGEREEELSPFARELRRLLTGAALREVAEPSGERYLELTFERAAEAHPLVLAAELFGSGNVVVARDGKVAAVAHPRRWAHRDLRVGKEYLRPPAHADPWTLTPGAIEDLLLRSRSDLASTLAARLGLGGPVAEELLARAGWGGGEPAASRAKEAAPRVAELLSELVAEIGAEPRGYLVVRQGEALDASPYRPRRWEGVAGVETEERPTFSEAAVAFFPTALPRAPSPEEEERRASVRELERLSERQTRAVEELTAAVQARKADAEAVFEHFATAEAALAEARSSGTGSERVEVRLGERTVELPVRANARASAQTLYEEAKRLAEKLEGARAALTVTRGRLQEPAAAGESRPAHPKGPAPKRFWFEKFRWFLSSEGTLVLAGKDAASNDLLVRRHLRPGDLYLHADLHGAASVVVKRGPEGAPFGEATIREAGQWAVAFSKAWRAGLGSASAFWADPDQVSKSAETGEFVPRGAWVVRGTHHPVKDLALELGIGTVLYEGEERWAVAPPPAFAGRGRLRFLLTPGEERDRGRVESDLARDLGVSRSLLQGLLPAGGLTVRRP